jgi:hypothetical protein
LFYHHGRDIFMIGKCGAKFKILKCSKQTLSPFPQQSTLVGPISQKSLNKVVSHTDATLTLPDAARCYQTLPVFYEVICSN